mmetsp:Transcript_54340/g.119179  ORF Transcript_54340/g.119179 Transcript_54340/m.119179 type:complete len:246 (+) Transcript_54340:478-1215(+)
MQHDKTSAADPRFMTIKLNKLIAAAIAAVPITARWGTRLRANITPTAMPEMAVVWEMRSRVAGANLLSSTCDNSFGKVYADPATIKPRKVSTVQMASAGQKYWSTRTETAAKVDSMLCPASRSTRAEKTAQRLVCCEFDRYPDTLAAAILSITLCTPAESPETARNDGLSSKSHKDNSRHTPDGMAVNATRCLHCPAVAPRSGKNRRMPQDASMYPKIPNMAIAYKAAARAEEGMVSDTSAKLTG